MVVTNTTSKTKKTTFLIVFIEIWNLLDNYQSVKDRTERWYNFSIWPFLFSNNLDILSIEATWNFTSRQQLWWILIFEELIGIFHEFIHSWIHHVWHTGPPIINLVPHAIHQTIHHLRDPTVNVTKELCSIQIQCIRRKFRRNCRSFLWLKMKNHQILLCCL